MAKKLQSIKCCICTAAIPEDRIIRKGVTCSQACRKELNARRRQREDVKFCRRCGQPCTPEEKKAFNKWRLETGMKQKHAGRPKMSAEQKQAAAQERYFKKHGVPMPKQAEFTDMINV